jgi:CubicO group peptidase (beta-lactamase class C family)
VGWASAVKPTTCTCLLKLWDRGKLDLDDKVTKFIPEFGVNGKENLRLRHLLTHTAHLGGYAGPQNLPPTFEEMVNKIIKAPREPYRPMGANAKLPPPGLGPGYNPAGIIVIAEICRRLYGRDFKEVIRKEVYEPCGMLDSWCGMPLERYRAYKAEGRFASGYLNSETEVVKCQPAGGGIGPTRELARFYEMLINRGTINGQRILSPQAVEAMTTPKTGLGYMGIWGLGLNLELPEGVTMPTVSESARAAGQARERYGPHASHRTFGHAGASGMQAFADPEYGLATAFIGRVPIHGALYEDLGLVKAA